MYTSTVILLQCVYYPSTMTMYASPSNKITYSIPNTFLTLFTSLPSLDVTDLLCSLLLFGMVTPYLPSSHNHRRRLPILLKIGMISSVNTMYCHLLHTATSMKIRYLFATQNVYIRYGPCIRNIFVFMHIYLQTHHLFSVIPTPLQPT
jgi:hypothetical protein